MKLAQQENDLRFHHERNVNETVSRSGTEYKGKRVVTMFLVCQISFPGNWPVKEGWKQTKKNLQNQHYKTLNKKQISLTKKIKLQEKTGIQWSWFSRALGQCFSCEHKTKSSLELSWFSFLFGATSCLNFCFFWHLQPYPPTHSSTPLLFPFNLEDPSTLFFFLIIIISL